jgi:autotransporter-associated beta strand protein
VECRTLDVSRNAAGNIGGSAGVVNLNGGTLQINGAVTNASNTFQTGGTPTATFNFNGGTLKANKTGVVTFQGSVSTPVIPIATVVKSGGAIIQTANGKQMIILEPLVHDSTLGGTPDGGLTKNGSDLLTLAAANTYTGNTTVNGGILALSGTGAIVSPHIILAGNTVFDVSGVGGFALVSGQILTNSSSPATLNGNADATAGTVSLTYAAGTPAFTVTNGTLTLAVSTTFTINNTGSALAAGSYEIISTNSDTAGGPMAAVAGSMPTVTVTGGGVAGGDSSSLSISNGELFLVVTSSNPFPGPAPTVSVGTGSATVNYTGVQGLNYSVSRSTNLVNWVIILTTNAPAGGAFSYTDTFNDLGAQPPTAFYRLQWNNH